MHNKSNEHGAANGYDKDFFLRIIYPDIHLRRMAYPLERRFRKFVQDVFETDLTTLFTSKESEEYKINQIDNWWNSY